MDKNPYPNVSVGGRQLEASEVEVVERREAVDCDELLKMAKGETTPPPDGPKEHIDPNYPPRVTMCIKYETTPYECTPEHGAAILKMHVGDGPWPEGKPNPDFNGEEFTNINTFEGGLEEAAPDPPEGT